MASLAFLVLPAALSLTVARTNLREGTSISLAYISANQSTGTVMEDVKVQAPVQQQAPAAPVTIPVPEVKEVPAEAAPQQMPVEQKPEQKQ